MEKKMNEKIANENITKREGMEKAFVPPEVEIVKIDKSIVTEATSSGDSK